MERDEIIKALECCSKEWHCGLCKYKAECKKIKEETLTLITSQEQSIKELTEENERLKAEKSAALDTFAEKLKRYYNALDGRTPAVLVAYHIDQIKEEMLKTDKKCD